MFVANTPAALRLLDLIWLFDADVNHNTWEQNAIKCVTDRSPDVRRQILFEQRPASTASLLSADFSTRETTAACGLAVILFDIFRN